MKIQTTPPQNSGNPTRKPEPQASEPKETFTKTQPDKATGIFMAANIGSACGAGGVYIAHRIAESAGAPTPVRVGAMIVSGLVTGGVGARLGWEAAAQDNGL